MDKESTCWHRRCRLNPWAGKIPGGGNGNPLQYSCLENCTDRGAWWATIHGVAESDTPEHARTTIKGKGRLTVCLLMRQKGRMEWFKITSYARSAGHQEAHRGCVISPLPSQILCLRFWELGSRSSRPCGGQPQASLTTEVWCEAAYRFLILRRAPFVWLVSRKTQKTLPHKGFLCTSLILDKALENVA